MPIKLITGLLSIALLTGTLFLSGCASDDMMMEKSMDSSMDKPMMKDSMDSKDKMMKDSM